MIMSRRSRARLCVAMAAGLSASIQHVQLAHAQQNPSDPTVYLNANDASGASSFFGGPTYQWGTSSNSVLPAGSAPTAGYAYVVTGSNAGTGVLRTPSSGSASFAGDSLTILPFNAQANLYNTSTTIVNPVDKTAGLFISGNVLGQTITVNNLVLGNGGAVLNAGYNASTTSSVQTSSVLNGAITLLPTGTTLDGITTTMSGGIIDGYAGISGGPTNLLVVNATLNGSGLLHVISSGGSTNATAVALNSSNPSFSGGVTLDNTIQGGSGNQPYLYIDTPTALGTGTFTINSSTTTASGGGPTIDNASGAPETLSTNNHIVLNGDVQYHGNGSLVSSNYSLNLGSGGITLNSNATIEVYGNGVLSETGTINGAYTLTVYNPGIFEVPAPSSIQTSYANVASGSTLAFSAQYTTASQFAAFVSSNTASGTSTIFNFSSGTSVGIDTTGVSGTFVQNVAMTGPLGLNKLGTGTLQLSTPNSYTGVTNISAGTLQLGIATALANTSSVAIAAGGTLDLNGFSLNMNYATGVGTITNSTTAPVTLTIVTGGSSSTAVFGGNISNGNATTSLTVNLTTATNFFNMNGANNSYTGTTTLKSGILEVGANSLSGNSVVFSGGMIQFSGQPTNNSLAFTAASGSNYNFNATSGTTVFLPGGLSNTSTGAASVNMSGAGVVIIGGTNTYTGATNIGSGTFGFSTPSAFTPAITAGGINLPSSTGYFGIGNSTGTSFNLSIPITGSGGLNKVGTDTVTLTGTGNTYTGVTNVSAGTLALGGSSVLPTTSSVSVLAGASFDLNGNSATVPNLLGTGVVTNNGSSPAILTIGTGGSTGFAGTIANGASTVGLNVNLSSSTASFNMSTGQGVTAVTTLSSGNLIAGASTFGSGASVVFNGGNLVYSAQPVNTPTFSANGSNSYSFNATSGTVAFLSGGLADSAAGPTSVNMTGSGAVIFTGTSTYTGSTNITGGTFGFATLSAIPSNILTNGVYVAGSGVTGSPNGYFGIGNNTSNYSFALGGSGVNGPGGLNKVGTDTVVLTGTNNTYTGITNVSNGTLQLGNASALGNSSIVCLGPDSAAPNGTFDMNGFSQSISIIGGAYGGIVTNSNSSSPATLTLIAPSISIAGLQGQSGGASFYGEITGNISVVMNNPATTVTNWGLSTSLNFNNSNSYTGTTQLDSGILQVQANNMLPPTHQVYMNGATLEISNNSTYQPEIDPTPAFVQGVANQQYNILIGSGGTDSFNTSLNSSGGSLTLGNTALSSSGGELVLAAANYYTGPTTVNVGILQIASPLALAGTSGVTLNATYPSPFILGSTAAFTTLQINDSSGSVGLAGGTGAPITLTLSGLGAVSAAFIYRTGITNHTAGFEFWGALEGTTGQSDVFGGNIVLNGGGNPVGISGGYANTSGGSLKLTGSISGTGPLVLGLNSNSTTILASANTYSGETQITSTLGTPTTVQLGANAAIPAGSGLDFANCNLVNVQSGTFAYATATFDLHGFSTSTAYVTSSTSTITNFGATVNTTNSNQGNGLVTNLQNGSTSTLTILGTPPSGPFLGKYQDGSATAKLGLDFDGGVQTLTGTNNYSGGTTVDAGTLIVPGLTSINPTGAGNLNVNSSGGMIIQNTALSTLFAKAQSGYSNGNWNGSGIISSTAAADTTHLTAVGMLQPSNTISFEGQTVNPTDVALKLTYYGDADLNGEVDGSDYSLIDNGYLQHLTGWQNGDFNYDGIINGSDYTLIDNSYNTQGAQFSAEIAAATAQTGEPSGTSAVPEPASLGLLTLGAGLLLGRRRRNKM